MATTYACFAVCNVVNITHGNLRLFSPRTTVSIYLFNYPHVTVMDECSPIPEEGCCRATSCDIWPIPCQCQPFAQPRISHTTGLLNPGTHS